MNEVVLDASVAVKWFREEDGAYEARELLRHHGSGEITIVVSSLFVYEVMGVASRLLDPDECARFWELFVRWRIVVSEVGDSLIRDALHVSVEHGCSFYDAVAPALAAQLGATLYSADRRAHRGLPGAVLIG